jgi:hypothetical protein
MHWQPWQLAHLQMVQARAQAPAMGSTRTSMMTARGWVPARGLGYRPRQVLEPSALTCCRPLEGAWCVLHPQGVVGTATRLLQLAFLGGLQSGEYKPSLTGWRDQRETFWCGVSVCVRPPPPSVPPYLPSSLSPCLPTHCPCHHPSLTLVPARGLPVATFFAQGVASWLAWVPLFSVPPPPPPPPWGGGGPTG